MSLSAKIRYAWPSARSPENYILGEASLLYWDSVALGQQPTIDAIQAVEIPNEPEARMVTPSELLSRLTDSEIVLFQASTNATVIRYWIGLTTSVTDFNSLETVEMFGFFVSLNLLSELRASEVLG